MEQFWQTASFRGAEFYVNGFDRAGGRRGPDHEFPNKEEGYPEDLGAKIGEYSFEAYVVKTVNDPDYGARRDALIAALEQPGPGELAHPVFGMVRVQLRSWSTSESKDALGVAVFKLSFVQASAPTYPTAKRAAAAGMPGLAASGHQSAADYFADAFSVVGKSDYLRDCAAADAEAIGSLYSGLSASFGIPVDMSGMLSALTDAILGADTDADNVHIAECVAAFPKAVTAWHEEPYANRRNLDGTYRGVSNFNGNGPLAVSAATSLFRVFDFALDETGIDATTTIRRQRATNSAALAMLTRESAIIESARVAPFVNWPTLQAAQSVRDRLAPALDAESEKAQSDGLYVALYDIRILISQSVPPEDGRLPSLMDYVMPATMPSLRLSYRLYGSGDRADELRELNGVWHPGFMPGGETIQVLANVG